MGYDDPSGDIHEQRSLLGSSSSGLQAKYRQLYGTGSSIRHSDFRAGAIKHIKITVTGSDDYSAYVDNNQTIAQAYAQDRSGMNKDDFGSRHWIDYVKRRSVNKSTIEQYKLPHEVKGEYTWVAPTVPGGATAAPKHIQVEFGDTVEFEVVYTDQSTGEKFLNYRR